MQRPSFFFSGPRCRWWPHLICIRCVGYSYPSRTIHNNAAEQAIRAIAVGLKNWLFFGSGRGGRAAAIHFSLIASARRHDIDPFTYLRDLLTRIPTRPNHRMIRIENAQRADPHHGESLNLTVVHIVSL